MPALERSEAHHPIEFGKIKLHASEPSAVRCEPRLVASLCDRGGRLKGSVGFKLTGVGIGWHKSLVC